MGSNSPDLTIQVRSGNGGRFLYARPLDADQIGLQVYGNLPAPQAIEIKPGHVRKPCKPLNCVSGNPSLATSPAQELIASEFSMRH